MALFFYKEKNKDIRAAAYLRLSIEDGDKAESNSIGNQRELIRDFAAERPGLHLVEEYADDGYTGTNFERPGFKRMMEDGVILVYVITFGSDGRARGRVAHFDGTASLLVHPIQIGLGVWNFRLNLKNVCTDGIRQIFGNFCGDTAGRKVGDKSFAHGNALPLDDFV